MAKFELRLPKMGESVAEATITAWLKDVGDAVVMDESILEIATDKVDSEVPSEVNGILTEKYFDVDAVVEVGDILAIIETDETAPLSPTPVAPPEKTLENKMAQLQESVSTPSAHTDRVYSPLVKNIAKKEQVSESELRTIIGTGKDGRVTKDDILNHIKSKDTQSHTKTESKQSAVIPDTQVNKPIAQSHATTNDEHIEMTRMGKLIASHMVSSVQTAAHVQSFIEADVTKIWKWRAAIKDDFMKREGEKITFTPIFMEAVAKALRQYPMLNISLKGDTIIKKKAINLGMATALPDGNLIVPVIKNADQLNLVGMTKQVNDLARRARQQALTPDDIQDGTYTVTNVGAFESLMGTPIINQPQVGILALGAIRKVPAVIETSEGDFIGIRHKMFLSHSYDHRVVNGALGGLFLKAVKDYLEAWDSTRKI